MGSGTTSGVFGVLAYFCSLGSVWYFLPSDHGIEFAVDVPSHKMAAWFHYSANNVEIVETFGNVDSTSSSTVSSVDLIAQSPDPGFDILHLIPILFCAIFGLLVVSVSKNFVWDLGGMVAGYAIAMLAGAWFFSIRSAGLGVEARVGPDYAQSLISGSLIAAAAGVAGALLMIIVKRVFAVFS